MPYYKESFVNRSVQSSWTGQPAADVTPVVLDSAEVTSFRSRPHPNALGKPVVVSDLTADPYAHFLVSTSEKRYRERLRERGLRAEGKPDRGHAFELKRHTVTGQLHGASWRTDAGAGTALTNVFAYPNPGIAGWLDSIHDGRIATPASYKEAGLDAFAQQAYARSAPTAVVFDAAAFLGELREGLPKLTSAVLKDLSKFYKGAGSDYLNVEFGWKPFLSDLQNAAKALLGATQQLSNVGERVHRTYGLPAVLESGVAVSDANITLEARSSGFIPTTVRTELGWPTLNVSTACGAGRVEVMKTRTSRRWFEGSFTNFLPIGFDPSDYFDRLNQLVNTKVTPATLWQLAPWSWLVDWELRIGDTIAANELVANDRLIMHYGYAMEETVYTTDLSWTRTSQPSSTSSRRWLTYPNKGRYFIATTYKRRLRANPYGFRAGSTGSLSGSQLSILGALGLTRTR